MANKLNKELQEQINLRKELLELSYEEQSQIDDTASTLQSRTDILQKIVSTSESAASLEDKAASYADIRTELEEKIAHYKKLGHTAQADSFALELEVLKTKEDQVTAQQTTNKAMKDAGDSLFGGLITKGEKLVETMKKPGGVLAVGLMAAVALMVSFSKQTDKIGEKFGALGTTKMAQDLREANVTAVKLGRNIDDVMGVLSLSRGLTQTTSDEHKLAADWDGNGAIGIDDVMGILSRSRGMELDDDENEVTSVPNIDKLDVEIEAPKAAGVTIGQIAGTNPEDATVDEAGPTKQAPQPSPEEVMSDLQREAGTLRQQGKGNA